MMWQPYLVERWWTPKAWWCVQMRHPYLRRTGAILWIRK